MSPLGLQVGRGVEDISQSTLNKDQYYVEDFFLKEDVKMSIII